MAKNKADIFISFLQWTVEGLANKLNDIEFIDFVSKYDILNFNETWKSQITDINIKGFDCFNCPRSTTNIKANRFSGGIVVYYKESLNCNIELVNIYLNGLVWFKLKCVQSNEEISM